MWWSLNLGAHQNHFEDLPQNTDGVSDSGKLGAAAKGAFLTDDDTGSGTAF